MRVHRMTVRSVAKANKSHGHYTGLDINASIRAGREEFVKWPEVSFKNGISCKFGKVPRIDGLTRGFFPDYHKHDDSYHIIGLAVFMHLGGNAFKAKATKFTVETYCRGPLAVIDVSDDGLGIPRNLERKLFKEGATFTTPQYQGGQGLGLYYTKMAVQYFGGTIGLIRNVPATEASKTNPSGVTFRITLPIDGFGFE